MPPERGRGQLSLGGRDCGAGAPRMGSGAGEPRAVKMRCPGRPGSEQLRCSQACGLYPEVAEKWRTHAPPAPSRQGLPRRSLGAHPALAQRAGTLLLGGLAVFQPLTCRRKASLW